MFKGIQDIMQKSEKLNPPKKPEPETASKPKSHGPEDPHLWPVLEASHLLSDAERNKYLESLPDLLNLELSKYNELCKPVLRLIAEFYQELPYTEFGFHSQRGGILDFTLERTFHSLSISRTFFLPTGSELLRLTYPQQLWAYAVFTASLLKEIGHVVTQFKVHLFSKDKKPLCDWQPYTSAMGAQGADYYDFEFRASDDSETKAKATVLLARHFLPAKGFEWLTSNPEVFQTWIALLEGDEIRTGTFGPIFMRAEAISIKRFLADLQNVNINASIGKGQLADFFSKLGALRNVDAKSEFETLARAVNDFLHWLKSNIASDKLAIGSEDLKFTKEGLMITDDMFKSFTKDSSGKYHQWKAIKEALTRFGIVKPGMEYAYYGSSKVIYHKPVILNNFHLAMPAAITPTVLRLMPKLQHGFVKMAGSINQQMSVKYISPDGQLVSKRTQEAGMKLSEQEKRIEQRIEKKLQEQPASTPSPTSPGTKR